jgi:isoleucyl-tRNA synthetase
LIFRATKQWFCDLSKGGLKRAAVQAVDDITMIPSKSGNSFKAALGGRLEWCLSRQRIWGVPIPAFMCTKCDYTFITQGLVDKVAQQVEKQGIEYWDSATPHELMPQNFICPLCRGTEFKKEQDILDVWFDSGISHFAVLKDKIGFPADIYLEGKDQYRGWFQSSLLTGMVLEGAAPMKAILTHGYTVDEKGRKMSKSLGNVVAPDDIIKQIGTDGLRLWAASVDYADELVVSDAVLQNIKEVYRKIRNTSRFLLSLLYDFDIDKDAVPLDKLRVIDSYALQRLVQVNHELLQHYQEFDFTALFHRLADYCAVDLSAFYLDIIKDRTYVEQADGLARRSAQTVCWYILDTMTRLMAPILSFTAEQISDYYQKDKKLSIHLQEFAAIDHLCPLQGEACDERQWASLAAVRSGILKAIEGLRAQGVVKHSLEVHITLFFEQDTLGNTMLALQQQLSNRGQTLEQFFKEFLIVSQVTIAADATGLDASRECNGLYVKVAQADGEKCPRCWHWERSVHEHRLCVRCQKITSPGHLH